jgi:chromosome segregation ATPase
MLKTSL